MSSDRWNVRPGEFITRQDLHLSFGFSLQKGVGYSARSQHVALHYASNVQQVGEGLGWSNGSFYYQGADLRHSNDIILNSKEQGRCLHLFEHVGRVGASGRSCQRYVESFVLAGVHSVERSTASSPVRIVENPVFKLDPVSTAVHRPWQVFDQLADSGAKVVPVQRHELVRWEDRTLSEQLSRLGPEARLENEFCRYLFSQGRAFHRWQINFDESHRPLFTDVWIPGLQLLLETKSSTSRAKVREAIGQLADYGRFIPGCRRAILVPGAVSSDLIALLRSQAIGAIWPDGRGGWEGSERWLRL